MTSRESITSILLFSNLLTSRNTGELVKILMPRSHSRTNKNLWGNRLVLYFQTYS